MLYIISMLALLTSFILINKSEKKQNLIFWITLSLIMLFCYNGLVCYIFSLIHIPCNLITLCIPNFVIAIFISLLIFKAKKFQKYEIRKRDFLAVVILLMLTISIAKINNGQIPLQTNYESTDAATHFAAAKSFHESCTLLANAENTTLFGFEDMMPLSYINTGLSFFLFDNALEEYQLYNLYIIMDYIVLLLSGLLFYSLFIKETDKALNYIIALIASILYMTAYQLNSLIFGFSYLSLGIDIIIAIFAVFKLLVNEDFSKKSLNIMLLLLNFGLFFSYYFFVPVVYLAEGLYIMWFDKKATDKWILKQSLLTISITLILPTLLGIQYLIIPLLLSSQSAISVDGYIYKDLFANFILFVPFVIYYMYDKIKNKTIDLFVLAIPIEVLFMISLFVLGVFFGKVSAYYFYKTYYFTYFLFIYATCQSAYILIKERKKERKASKDINIDNFITICSWNSIHSIQY